MKRIAILFAVLAVFLWVGSAGAFIIDGDWTDWGITVADNNGSNLTPSAGIGYWIEDTNDNENGYYVGPGYGGQDFDAEGIYVAISGGNLYFAVVSGARSDNVNNHYEPGDIMITTTSGMYALETTGYRYDLSSGGYVTGETITGESGGLYKVDGNHSEGDTGSTLVMNGLSNWAGSPDRQDPVQLWSADGALLDSGNFFFTNDNKTTQHSFMEGMVALSILDGDVTGVHWAYACGNDGGTAAPVPEPATMLLFGTGLIGLAAIGRKKFLKQG